MHWLFDISEVVQPGFRDSYFVDGPDDCKEFPIGVDWALRSIRGTCLLRPVVTDEPHDDVHWFRTGSFKPVIRFDKVFVLAER